MFRCMRKSIIGQRIKEIVKKIIGVQNAISVNGDFDSWENALSMTTGYDTQEVFQKTAKAALDVLEGKACYERDSVLFYKESFYYELLYYIERSKKDKDKTLILDFGGGLGSMFFQNRKKFDDTIEWTIVEQAHFVEFGKKYLQCEGLRFVDAIEEDQKYDVVILGSSLQYIKEWKNVLDMIMRIEPNIVFIDRTPMSDTTWIAIEKVDESIYNASYPLWIFDKKEIDDFFTKWGYELCGEWQPDTGPSLYWKNKIIRFESIVYSKNRMI